MSDFLLGDALTAAVRAGDADAIAAYLYAICARIEAPPAPKETDR